MTFRELFVTLGFQIDENSLNQANAVLESVRNKGNELLDAIHVKPSKSEIDSLNQEIQKTEDQIEDVNKSLKNESTIQDEILDLTEQTNDANKKTSNTVDKLVQKNKTLLDVVEDIQQNSRNFLGAIGVGISLMELNSIAEEFNGINDQIRNATREMGEQTEIQQVILDTANNTRTSYGDTAKFVGALVQENNELFGTVEEAAKYAELTTKLFKGAGKSNDDVVSLQEAINKSFAKGILDSETLNQLFERAPEAVALLTDELGVTKEQLLSMASEGSVSIDVLKSAFLNNADIIEQSFGELDLNISDALLNIRNQWGYWVDQMNSTLGIGKTIAKIMVTGFSKIMDVLKKISAFTTKLVDQLGGFENVLKLISGTAASIFLAIKADKIKTFLKNSIGLLRTVNKNMLLTHLKTMAIAAIFLALFLIVEDFIGFLQGKDSLLGSLLENAGVDINAVRENILKLWNDFKTFFFGIADFIKSGVLTGNWKDAWSKLAPIVSKAGDLIAAALKGVLKLLLQMLGFSSEEAEERVEQFVEIAVLFFNRLKDNIKEIFEEVRAFWDQWGSQIMEQFSIIWTHFKETIEAIKIFLQGLIDFILGVFTGNWEQAWEGIKTMFTGILEGIRATFKTIWDSIYNWFGKKIDAFVKKVQDFTDGIKKKFQGVVDFFGGIGDTIGGFFGNDNLDATVKATTVNASTGGGNRTNNVTQNVTTNNTFNGGDPAMQKKGAEVISKQAEDSYEYASRRLARG